MVQEAFNTVFDFLPQLRVINDFGVTSYLLFRSQDNSIGLRSLVEEDSQRAFSVAYAPHGSLR